MGVISRRFKKPAYLAIDIGATKTLIAPFSKKGQIITKIKFPTPQDYQEFEDSLRTNISNLGIESVTAVGIGIPGLIDHKTGLSIDTGGNLSWKNVPVKEDVAKMLAGPKVYIHNDAKLAGLSEAVLLKQYKKVLYLTISTGIGGAVIVDGLIDPDFINFEPGRMPLEHEGKVKRWEQFASGKAFYDKYHVFASDAKDPKILKAHSKLIAMGLNDVLANVQPEVVVMGGGLGAHIEKFKHFLIEELKVHKDKLVPIPPLVKAKRAEEAVIYGCYEFIKQNG
jgi:glucokinase